MILLALSAMRSSPPCGFFEHCAPSSEQREIFLRVYFKSLLVGGHFSLASRPKVVGLCFLQPIRLCKEPNARLLLVSLLSKSTMLCIPFLLLLRFFSGFRLDCFHLPSGACILWQGFLSLPLIRAKPGTNRGASNYLRAWVGASIVFFIREAVKT